MRLSGRILPFLALAALISGCDSQEPLAPGNEDLPAPQLATFPPADVAIIGGSTLNSNFYCGYSGSYANVMGHTYGGCLPVAGHSALTDFSFHAVAPGAVTTGSLAGYDIAVVNMATTDMDCNPATLTPAGKAEIVAFAGAGKKVIIFDSECTVGGAGLDYSWLPYPFTTANPGARGATGILTIVEDNTLSSKVGASPYFIDAGILGSRTDAVGDMNVMTTQHPAWCVDMAGTNVRNVTGAVHTYANYPTGTDFGLFIYNGLDMDYLSYSYGDGIGSAELFKVWVNELNQPVDPSGLPCRIRVVSIALDPPAAENHIGESHTVTATVSDLLSGAEPDVTVTFTVISGPNAGDWGTGVTDADGKASFTYPGDGGLGEDEIQACFTNDDGVTKCSNVVTKNWYVRVEAVLTPADATNHVGEDHTVTATLTDLLGVPQDGVSVTITVFNGPNAGETFTGDTDPAGQVSFTYTGDGGLGTDELEACFIDPYGDLKCSKKATKSWVNVPPVCSAVTVDPEVVLIGTEVLVSATFDDAFDPFDHTAVWDWGDGTSSAGTVDQDAHTVGPDGHSYGAVGSYRVNLTVTDNFGASCESLSIRIRVYDPDAGFITGGGWIASPAGAYRPDPSVEGKTTFGFVAKYKKGDTVPTGNVELQLHDAGMNFHAQDLYWLLVMDDDTALLRGEGTVNGALSPSGHPYVFMLWFNDAKPDLFRFWLWETQADGSLTQLYITGPPLETSGGNLVIHKGK